MEREYKFHAAYEAVVSQGKSAGFEGVPVGTPWSDPILMLDKIASIPFHVERVITKLGLQLSRPNTNEFITLCEQPRSCWSIVPWKMVWAHLKHFSNHEGVIDNFGLIAPTAVPFRSVQRKYTNEIVKIRDRCREYVEAGKKLGPVAVSNQSDIGEETLTDISNDVKMNPEAYSVATLRRSIDDFNPTDVQAARIVNSRARKCNKNRDNQL